MIRVFKLNEAITTEEENGTIYVYGLTINNISGSDIYKNISDTINLGGHIQTSEKTIQIYQVGKIKYMLMFKNNKDLRAISTFFYTEGLH